MTDKLVEEIYTHTMDRGNSHNTTYITSGSRTTFAHLARLYLQRLGPVIDDLDQLLMICPRRIFQQAARPWISKQNGTIYFFRFFQDHVRMNSPLLDHRLRLVTTKWQWQGASMEISDDITCGDFYPHSGRSVECLANHSKVAGSPLAPKTTRI